MLLGVTKAEEKGRKIQLKNSTIIEPENVVTLCYFTKF